MELSTGLGVGCGFGLPRRSCGFLRLQRSSSQRRIWLGVCAAPARKLFPFRLAGRVSRYATLGSGNSKRVTYPQGRSSDQITLHCPVRSRRDLWRRSLWDHLRLFLHSVCCWDGWPRDLRGRLHGGDRLASPCQYGPIAKRITTSCSRPHKPLDVHVGRGYDRPHYVAKQASRP